MGPTYNTNRHFSKGNDIYLTLVLNDIIRQNPNLHGSNLKLSLHMLNVTVGTYKCGVTLVIPDIPDVSTDQRNAFQLHLSHTKHECSRKRVGFWGISRTCKSS